MANGLSGVYHAGLSSVQTGATAHQVCPLTSLQQWHRACNEPPIPHPFSFPCFAQPLSVRAEPSAHASTRPARSALRAAVLILATGADAGDTQLPGAAASARAAAAQRHAVAGPSRAAAGHEQRGCHCARGCERASLLPNLARSHCPRFVPAVLYLLFPCCVDTDAGWPHYCRSLLPLM